MQLASMMNDPNQVIHAEALAIVPAKRKRGRPRKYPALDDQNLYLGDRSPSNGGDKFHLPSSYRRANGRKSRHVDSRDGMTGQAVSGFLEAEFDGGYLLSVRVRNSDTVLRGVVFRPGRFVPVSADNDIAPNVDMIKRNEMPLHSENYGRTYGGSHSRSRERNGVAYSHSGGSGVLKSKIISPTPLQAVSSVPLRGDIVPMVVQPVTSTNNGTPNQRVSVGNQDSHHSSPSMSKETQPVALQVVHPDVQSTPATQVPITGESGTRGEPDNEYEIETKPVISSLPAKPFETEVTKRIQSPPETDNTENSQGAGKSSSSPDAPVDTTPDQSPMHVDEPFQAVNSSPLSLSHSVPNLEGERTGKMTELLQAVQENAMKNQMSEPR